MTKAIFKSINTKNKLFKRNITFSNKDDHLKYKYIAINKVISYLLQNQIFIAIIITNINLTKKNAESN